VILLTAFAILIGLAVAATFKPDREQEARTVEWDAALKQELRSKGQGSQMLGALGLDAGTDEIQREAATNRTAALYDAALRYERKEKIPEKQLDFIAASPMKHGKAIAEIYRAPKLALPKAKSLAAELPEDGYIYRVVRAQALLKAGDDSLHQRLARMPNAWLMIGVAILGCGAMLLGLFLWFAYFSVRGSGALKPLGHPVEPISRPMADALILRADQLLAIYLAMGAVIGLALDALPSAASSILKVAVMIGLVLAVFRLPVFGRVIRLSELGVNGRKLGLNVLWGLGGYIATVPILLITGMLAQVLGRYLPKPSHPIGLEIFSTTNPWVIFGIFLQAVILAAFWEEIMFRGCIFPAFSRVTNRVALGAIGSSFLFGAIHPQGIAGWPPLMAIALVSCALAHQTKSLVPSMVLHGLNNGVALAVGLIFLR
jgi:membrane protease YdiL (CAAX protease family)